MNIWKVNDATTGMPYLSLQASSRPLGRVEYECVDNVKKPIRV